MRGKRPIKEVFSKRGDDGITSLLYGQRVPKFDPRPETYGTIDEAMSLLGLSKALTNKRKVKEIIERIQKDLFILNANIATSKDNHQKAKHKITSRHTKKLEEIISELATISPLSRKFIIPGETTASAAIDISRAVIRRAERMVHKIIKDGILKNREVGRYLNRLADLLFLLARYEEK